MAYRTGIIGCGRIASILDEDPLRAEIWTHAGAYRASPHTDLVAAADIDATKVQSFGEKWGVTALYRDPQEMLKSEGLDIVSVCTPPAFHAEMVQAAAEAGVRAIFCEKPLTCSLADADALIEVTHRRGVGLQVNHPRRWDPVYEEARERIRQGNLGRLWSFVGYGDTALFTNAIHLLDMIRFLAGEVIWVEGIIHEQGIRIVDGFADSGATALLGLANGGVAFVRACGPDWRYHQFEADLWGDRGRLRIWNDGRAAAFWAYGPSLHNTGYVELSEEPTVVESKVSGQRMLKAVEELVRWTEGAGNLRCTGEDGRAALELVLAIHASAQFGGRITLPLEDRSWRWEADGVKR